MNSRNIKAHLQKKFNEWVESIEDKNLRKTVKEHSMISGGAITSLLLGEKPSDYDIYFDDFKTTYEVVSYYSKRIKSSVPIYVAVGDKHNITKYEHLQHIPTDATNSPRIMLVMRSSGIAGEEPVEGYQYFETIGNPENVDVEQYIEELTGKIEKDKDDKNKYQPIFATSNSITLSNQIQLIIRFYGSRSKIHENFDFEHCKNVWYSKDGSLLLTKEALETTINKQLIYSGSNYPLASMFRIRKFLSKGWYINVADMLKIAYQISELNLKDINILEDQLIGVDVAYFTSLIQHLRELKDKDPDFNMGFHYLSSVLEKAF
jgi:hypothetical protein